LDFGTDVNDAIVTTSMRTSPGGFLPGATGMPADETGAITLIVAGSGTGGIGDAVDILVTVVGVLSPLPPPCCGSL
jgi:hypothetical protein